jgi:hypothetical protein
MAKRKHNWAWRRLAEAGEAIRHEREHRPIEYRGDPTKRTVREHCPYPITPALERFAAMTERVLVGDDTCIIWRGGETFRVDDFTITTPARFYYEYVLGEKLKPGETLWKACKTPRCVKHKRVTRRTECS